MGGAGHLEPRRRRVRDRPAVAGGHALPALVSREARRLERANGRLVGTQVVAQELAGPPVGGFLFSAAAWIPFAVDAVTFAAGSALVAAIRGHFGPAQGELDRAGRRSTLRIEIAEGLRWLAAHRVLRTTAAMVAIVNLLAAAGGAVMVLFAQEKLGLVAVGFGLLLGGSAVGGVLGSLHQALTPDRLLGRVISAFRLFGYGAVSLGSLLGGVLARSFGLRAPFVVAGVVIPVAAVACLPAVNARTVAEARAAAGLEPES